MSNKITASQLKSLILEAMSSSRRSVAIQENAQPADLPFKDIEQFTSTSPIFKFDIFVQGDIATSKGGERTSTRGQDTQQKIIKEFSNSLPGTEPEERLGSLIKIFNDPLANLGNINDINGDNVVNGIDKISVFFRTYVIYNFLKHLTLSNNTSMGFALENWVAIVIGGTARQFFAGGSIYDIDVGSSGYSLKFLTAGDDTTATISQAIPLDQQDDVFDYIIVKKDSPNPSVIEFVSADVKGSEARKGLNVKALQTQQDVQSGKYADIERYLQAMEKYDKAVEAANKEKIEFEYGNATPKKRYSYGLLTAFGHKKKAKGDLKRGLDKALKGKTKPAIPPKPKTTDFGNFSNPDIDFYRDTIRPRLADPAIAEPKSLGTINIPEFVNKIDSIISSPEAGPDAQIISSVKTLVDSMEQLKVLLTLWWLNITGEEQEKQRATARAEDIKKSSENCSFLINKVSKLEELPESDIDPNVVEDNRDLVTRMNLPDIKINQIAGQDIGQGVMTDSALEEISSKINVPNASDPDEYIKNYVGELIKFFNSTFSDDSETSDISEVFAKVMMLQSFLFLFDLKISDPRSVGAIAGAVGGTTAGFALESLFKLMFFDGGSPDFVAKTFGGNQEKADFAVLQKSNNTIYAYSSKLRKSADDFKDSGDASIDWGNLARQLGAEDGYSKKERLVGFSVAAKDENVPAGTMSLHIGPMGNVGPAVAQFEFGADNFDSFMGTLETSLNGTKNDFLKSFETLNTFKIKTADFLSDPNTGSFDESIGSYNSFKESTNTLFTQFGETTQIAEVVSLKMLGKLILESFKK